MYSNLWVGLAVAALTGITSFSLFQFDYRLMLFVGSATAFTYCYMRLLQLPSYSLEGEDGFKKWYTRYPWVLGALAGFWAVLAYFLFNSLFDLKFLWLLILPGAVSMLYPISFKNPMAQFSSLRSLPGLKLLLISAVWSYVTVVIPSLLAGVWNLELLLEFCVRSLLIAALTIPFDIRDVQVDDRSMDTLPQRMGVRNAKQISLLLLLCYQLWTVVRVLVFGMDLPLAFALILGLELGHWLIVRSGEQRSELYYSFWLEGVPVFLFAAMWLVYSFF